MDNEIGSIDVTVDVSVQSFSSRVNEAMRSNKIRASMLQSFSSRVNEAMRSNKVGASMIQSFSSRVDNAIRSNKAGASMIQSFSSRVDDAIGSNTNNALPSPQVISNATGEHIVEGYRPFTLAEIEAATNNFSLENKIGVGFVYRGELIDDREVAIKTKKWSVSYPKFSSLSLLRHKYLVRLVGFYEEKDEVLVMYEYMKNGSLHDHLQDVKGSSVLNSWKMRIKIALDVARGIEYLHKYAPPSIIHGDIKSSKILLDATWTARIDDFGSSIFVNLKALKMRRWNVDVFGLGVVVLELLTGKSTIFKHGKHGDTPLMLANFAAPTISTGDSVTVELEARVRPPNLNEAMALKMVANIAVRCVKMALKASEVVAFLKDALIACDSSHGSFSNGIKAEKFTLAELLAATNHFSPKNRISGFVYKGKLGNGRKVAIKWTGIGPKLGSFELKPELAFLSRLHHKHLVRLVGYCQEKGERHLFFEYMKNGSLYDHLHDKNSSVLNSSWQIRIKIALDAARGIEYLHNFVFPSTIHQKRNIKSSNILVDATWTAKISDFGLSLMSDHKSNVGYIDPKYCDQNVFAKKSDVYAFGVILLELLTGKRAIFKHGEDKGIPLSVVDSTLPAILGKELVKILDPRVGLEDFMGNTKKALYLVADVAKRCLNFERKDRPTMAEIVIDLERALDLSIVWFSNVQFGLD